MEEAEASVGTNEALEPCSRREMGRLGVGAPGKQIGTREVGRSYKMWIITGPENCTQNIQLLL